MSKQPGDISPGKFSFSPSTQPLKKQLDCHMTHTSPEVHELLKEGFDRSPMFNGSINSTGPRYCPSIEDKINRFANKESHQIFVEPEGWNTVEVYVNGFSTSLPEDIQFRALSSVKGFENVKFFRPGYAIEYDYFPPTQLKNSLETKPVSGLFFAGQINGTTGYEEAAAQGLMAGINAHLKITEKSPFILRRNEAYIGVLIDDLITKGTDEPYRMFTSRAEYRTLLRQDNADLRLTELSYNLGLANFKSLDRVNKKRKDTKDFVSFFQKTSVKPEIINPILKKNKSSEIKQSVKLYKIFSRPNISLDEISKVQAVKDFVLSNNYDKGVLEQTEVQVKYSGYIEKERANAEKLNNLENIKIPSSFSYSKVNSLSTEAVQKLEEIRPTTLSQASRISGVSPNDISVLMVYMGR
jgi:tRNA uridine 5-carboxymethylaminomethyl modification enzyme